MSDTAKKGSIFNVDEVQGVEKVRCETTAAQAQAEAPNAGVAHQVEENAEHAQQAAEKAAQAAQGMGPELTGESRTAFDDLQRAAAQKTNAAAAEGQRDLHTAKDASASYLGQAKTMAENVVMSAQDYLLHGSINPQATANQQGSSTGPATAKTGGVISSLQTSTSSAVGMGQQYLASAQAVAQPHIDAARSTLQPHVDKARETAEGYLGMHSGTSPSDAVTPPVSGRSTTNAPLSGQEVKGTPYASTTTTVGADQKKLESDVA